MAQKVYVVTAGTYSDYHIERVFLDKDKAETYAQHIRETDEWYGDSVWVHDYDISDDVIINKGYCVEVYYCIPGLSKYDRDTYEMEVESYIACDANVQNETLYVNGRIHLTRLLNNKPSDADKERLAAKYLKVCEDIAAKVKYEFAMGASEYDVRSMFDSGAIKAIDDEEV